MRGFRCLIVLALVMVILSGSIPSTLASEEINPTELESSIRLAEDVVTALMGYPSLPYVDLAQLQNLSKKTEMAYSFLKSGNYSAANVTISEVWNDLDTVIYKNYGTIDFYYNVIKIDLENQGVCKNDSALMDELHEAETKLEILKVLLIQENGTINRKNIVESLPYLNETFYMLEILGAKIVACRLEEVETHYEILENYTDVFNYGDKLETIKAGIESIKETLRDGKVTKTEYLLSRRLIPTIKFEERKAIRDAMNQTGTDMDRITAQYFRLPDEFRTPCLGIIKGNLEILKNATNAMYDWDVERALELTYTVRLWVDNESEHTRCIIEKMDLLLARFTMNSTQLERSLSDMTKKYNDAERNLTLAWAEYNKTLQSKPSILIIDPSSKLELARLRLEEANRTLVLVGRQMAKIDGIAREMKNLEDIRKEAEGKNLTVLISISREFSKEYKYLEPYGVKIREIVLGTNGKLNDAVTMIKSAREILREVLDDYKRNNIILKLVAGILIVIAAFSIYLLKRNRKEGEK